MIGMIIRLKKKIMSACARTTDDASACTIDDAPARTNGDASARTNGNANEALIAAIRNGQYEEVRNLLEHDLDNIDINGNCSYIDDDYKTPLWEACAFDDARIVAILLEYGADPNHGTKVLERDGECYDYHRYAPLMRATERNVSKDVLSHLLRYGADPNVVGPNHYEAPLYWACDISNYDKIELLLRHGAKVNQRDRSGRTPVFGISSIFNFNDKHLSCLRLMLEHGADPNVISLDGATPLYATIHHSSGECRLDAIRFMMRHGADFTRPILKSYRTGDTILHYAVRCRDVDAVRAMTEHQQTWSIWWLRNNDDTTVNEVAAQLDAVPNIECFEMNLRNIRYDHFLHDWIQK